MYDSATLFYIGTLIYCAVCLVFCVFYGINLYQRHRDGYPYMRRPPSRQPKSQTIGLEHHTRRDNVTHDVTHKETTQ
jgi:hypothetical protein